MFTEMTAKEAADLLGCSSRAIRKRALQEKWAFKERNLPGGGKEKLYQLPEQIREKLAVEMEKSARKVVQAEPLGPGKLHEREGAVWGRPAAQRLALAKGDFLRFYSQAARSAAVRQGRTRAKQEFLAAYNTGLLHPEIFRQLGTVSFQTAERWYREWRETGDPLALAPRWPRRQGQTVPAEAMKVLLAVALHPNRLCIAEVIRVARRLMAARGVPDGLSDRTYRRALEDWRCRNYDYWTFYRRGERALHDECLPYLQRDYDRLEVGDALVADGHRLNFEIINPWTGKPKRMVLILFYDFKSNYPCGWEIMPEENTQAIAAAFRRALLCLGKPPLAVYLDNGKAFGAKFFTGNLAEAGLAGLFERLGCRVGHAWPYHAQSKTVERFFRSFGELERLLPSYTGTSIQNKPPRLKRGEKLHRRLHEKLAGPAPTLAEAHRAIAAWFDDYARRPQRGHLEGRSPWEVFQEWRERQGHPAMDPAALRYLMMSCEIRTINRNGIYFRGQNYYHPELYGRQHRVVVRYDEQDLSALLVYEPTGAYLCEATVVPGVHPLASVTGQEEDRQLLAAQIAQKQQLLRRTTATAREMAELIVGPEVQRQLAYLPEGRGQGPGARGQGPEAGEQEPGAGEKEKQAIEAEFRQRQAELAAEKAAIAAERQSEDWQRYEAAQEAELAGRLSNEEAVFMRYFELTAEYQQNRDYFEERRLELAVQLRAVGLGQGQNH